MKFQGSLGEPWSWMDKSEAIQLVQSFALVGTPIELVYMGWTLRMGSFYAPLHLGLFSFYHILGPTKWTTMTQIAMGLWPSWTFMVSRYSMYFGF